jgi:hypothetical protein
VKVGGRCVAALGNYYALADCSLFTGNVGAWIAPTSMAQTETAVVSTPESLGSSSITLCWVMGTFSVSDVMSSTIEAVYRSWGG